MKKSFVKVVAVALIGSCVIMGTSYRVNAIGSGTESRKMSWSGNKCTASTKALPARYGKWYSGIAVWETDSKGKSLNSSAKDSTTNGTKVSANVSNKKVVLGHATHYVRSSVGGDIYDQVTNSRAKGISY